MPYGLPDTDQVDYPASPTYQGWVDEEHDYWATHIAPRRHLRYDDAPDEPLPVPVLPVQYSGIGERDMLTPQQIALLDAALAARMRTAPKLVAARQPRNDQSKNDFGI